jgi:biotin carboxylase
MNVLITNSQEPQAYVILRCVRPHARRIVITEGSASVGSTGFRGMAAYSRFVDGKYSVPHFADDWLAGRLEVQNTDSEEAYIRRIEEICRLEQIDVVFPSLDPEVYLLAKNKERLASQGVLVVVPDPQVIRIPMDKALTIRAAQQVGFPTPKTWFPESQADIEKILAESAPPWIVKPRFTAHGANMVVIGRSTELLPAYECASAAQSRPIVQEYIRTESRQDYYVTVDRTGQILSLMSPKVTRVYRAGHRLATKVCVSRASGPCLDQLRALVRELGLWGGYTVQSLIDPRDGKPKLLEINPRFGQHLWWRTELGINEPMICLAIARGEQQRESVHFSEGVMMLDPYYDAFYLYTQIVEAIFRFGGRLIRRRVDQKLVDPEPGTPGVLATLRIYARDYLNFQPKVFGPEVSNLLSDPYPCLHAFSFKFLGLTGGYLQRARRAV